MWREREQCFCQLNQGMIDGRIERSRLGFYSGHAGLFCGVSLYEEFHVIFNDRSESGLQFQVWKTASPTALYTVTTVSPSPLTLQCPCHLLYYQSNTNAAIVPWFSIFYNHIPVLLKVCGNALQKCVELTRTCPLPLIAPVCNYSFLYASIIFFLNANVNWCSLDLRQLQVDQTTGLLTVYRVPKSDVETTPSESYRYFPIQKSHWLF